MNLIFLVFILMLQMAFASKSFGGSDLYYAQYCPPSPATFSAGGISIVKPVQSGGYSLYNNPASLTQNNISNFFYDAGRMSNHPAPAFGDSKYVDEDQIYDSPKQSKFYGYFSGNLGYIHSPKAFDQDASNDYLLFKNLKRNNLYWTFSICAGGDELFYGIKRKSNNDDLPADYSASYNKISMEENNFYFALGYKELIPGLAIGLSTALAQSRLGKTYNYMVTRGNYGEYRRDSKLDTNNFIASLGVAFGATYSLPSNPDLSVGAIVRGYHSDTLPADINIALPLAEAGGGVAWTFNYGRYELVNSAELLNISAKGKKAHNWTETHLGSNLKINFYKSRIFNVIRIRAGLNSGYPAAGLDFNLIGDEYGGLTIYYGAVVGKYNAGYASTKEINDLTGFYIGLVQYIN